LERLARSTDAVIAAAEEYKHVTPSMTLTVVGGVDVLLWMEVTAAGLFWGLFVFDMFGDIYGAVSGLYMILAPTVGGGFMYYLGRRSQHFAWCCDKLACRFRNSVNRLVSVHNPIINPQGSSRVFNADEL
jgi:hypothetical protein